MLHALQAIDELQEILGLGSVFLVVGFALIFGGKVERIAATLTLVDGFGLAAFSALIDRKDQFVFIEAKSLIMLFAYAALTYLWPQRWLMVLASLQALAVLLHVAVWVEPTIMVQTNALLLNAIGWLMLLTLGVGSVQTALERYQHPRGHSA